MGVASGWSVDGAERLVRALTEGAAKLPALVEVVVTKSAVDLIALTQQNASHRPGPNAPTGDYRGSWGDPGPARLPSDPESVSISVGTNRAQARRLEYGFVGTDSIGRTYDQPPYPHHGPAVDVIEPVFYAAMAKVAEQAVRW